MDAYTSFASVYEMFMDNIAYDEWGKYIIGILEEYGSDDGIILELGCGTGSLTRVLASCGYDMIGLDNAEDMLSIAIEREAAEQQNILYLFQDMREFELYGTVKAVICICDSINYITEPEELLAVFRLVNNYLDPKGIFIFDLNTIYKYREVMGDTTIAENREEGSFIWENFYDEDEKINEYDLSIFIPEGDLYRKYEEVHFQRAYEIDEIIALVQKAGLIFLNVYDAFTYNPPTDESERVYFVVQENGK